MLRYDIRQNQWMQAGILPFATPVTTLAHIHQDRIYLPSGEIRAGVRSPFIRIAKMPAAHE
jgi:N-acetylneuraminic acid mutarotase